MIFSSFRGNTGNPKYDVGKSDEKRSEQEWDIFS